MFCNVQINRWLVFCFKVCYRVIVEETSIEKNLYNIIRISIVITSIIRLNMSICHSNSALAVGVGDCGRGGGIERNQGNDRTRERGKYLRI